MPERIHADERYDEPKVAHGKFNIEISKEELEAAVSKALGERRSAGTPISHLVESHDLVYGDRNEAYGHPADDFARQAKIWSAILEVEVSATQVALCLVGTKLAREVNRPQEDNIIDAHGYLIAYDRVLNREMGVE